MARPGVGMKKKKSCMWNIYVRFEEYNLVDKSLLLSKLAYFVLKVTPINSTFDAFSSFKIQRNKYLPKIIVIISTPGYSNFWSITVSINLIVFWPNKLEQKRQQVFLQTNIQEFYYFEIFLLTQLILRLLS